MFHGFNPPTARMDGRTMTYRIAAPLQTYESPMYIPHQGRMYIALWGGAFIELMNAIEVKRRLP